MIIFNAGMFARAFSPGKRKQAETIMSDEGIVKLSSARFSWLYSTRDSHNNNFMQSFQIGEATMTEQVMKRRKFRRGTETTNIRITLEEALAFQGTLVDCVKC